MPELPPRLKVLYPFAGQHSTTPSGQLHYVDEGTGPAVVMLHGNPTWSFFYRDLILGLRDSFRCLAVDHLGCGFSDKPQRADYTLAGHIDRTVAWVESLDLEDFHLVVHDWGGAIGMGLASRLPDKVRSISILNTAAFPFPKIPARIAVCRIPLLGRILVRGANGFVRAALRMTTVEPLSEAAAEGFALPYGNWHDRVAVHAFVKDIPMRRGHRSWSTLSAIAQSLPQWRQRPVQIIWGMQDWCFHTGILARWQEILPEAAVHRFDNAGHYLFEDAGEQILPLIRDLAAPGRP